MTPGVPPEWRMVFVHEYTDSFDLTGKDLISMLDHSKEDVSRLVGKIVAKTEMHTEELPGQYVTSLTGQVADEVHEWPKATLGENFRHLILQFQEDRLVQMSWKFRGQLPSRNKPWWKFW